MISNLSPEFLTFTSKCLHLISFWVCPRQLTFHTGQTYLLILLTYQASSIQQMIWSGSHTKSYNPHQERTSNEQECHSQRAAGKIKTKHDQSYDQLWSERNEHHHLTWLTETQALGSFSPAFSDTLAGVGNVASRNPAKSYATLASQVAAQHTVTQSWSQETEIQT